MARRNIWLILSCLIMLASAVAPARAQDRLKIGITLHPYYSFVANIVGDLADIVPLIPASVNPHGYQPQAEDIKRAMSMDALVVNGIGHDEWAFEIIAAAGRQQDLPLIYANASVALIPIAGTGEEKIVNPHTFISTTAAVQQVYEIAQRLGEIDPPHADVYRANAREYAARIRRLRADFMTRFVELSRDGFRAATMHAGYDYLFQEFGLQIAAIIEPRHGVAPTPRQLARTIEEIKAANVTALFSEKYFVTNLAETVRRETGVAVYALSHISEGPFTPEKFEDEMRANIETLARAVAEASH